MAGPDSSSEDEGGPHSGSSGDEAPKLPRKVCRPTWVRRVWWEEDKGLMWSPKSLLLPPVGTPPPHTPAHPVPFLLTDPPSLLSAPSPKPSPLRQQDPAHLRDPQPQERAN